MDPRGNIHEMVAASEAAARELKESLERKVGKVVPIPHAELPAVRAMSQADRVAWYTRHLTPEAQRARKNERKRQRAARKAQRRAK